MPNPTPRRARFPRRAGVLVLLLLQACLAKAATFTVGTDPATCTFTSLAAAIAAAKANGPGSDTIRLGMPVAVPAGGLLIDGQDLVIDGGYIGCTGTTGFSRTLTGTAGATAPMLRIECTAGCTGPRNVILRNLILEGGGTGGLSIRGLVQVTTATVTIASMRSSGYGAGIRVEAGTGAKLGLGPGTALLDNIADSDGDGNGDGGGLYCYGIGGGSLDIELGTAAIIGNAAARGGGIALDGGCRALMTGSGALLQGIHDNTATDGGGVSVRGGSVFVAFGETGRAQIRGNSATQGGGVHVSGKGSLAGLVRAEISDNTVTGQGGGMYVELGGRLLVDAPASCAGVACNRISGNRATGASGRGGALEARSGAEVEIDRALITGNQARYASAIQLIPFGAASRPGMALRNSIVSGHSGSLRVVSQNGSNLLVEGVTFLKNTGSADSPLQATLESTTNGSGGGTWVSRSIFADRQGEFATALASGMVTVSCVLAERGSASVPLAPDSLVAPAGLVPAGDGSYTLAPGSPAIDLCGDDDAVTSNPHDFFGRPRGLDDPDVADARGPYDAGAIEFAGSGVFRDGFE